MSFLARPHLKGGWRITLNLYFVLEICWLIFWFVTILWLHLASDTATGFGYRSDLTNAFVHFTALTMMIYSTSEVHKAPDLVVLIIFIAVMLYDVQILVITLEHASRIILPTAYNLQVAVISVGLAASSIAVIWYLFYYLSTRGVTFKKKKTFTYDYGTM